MSGASVSESTVEAVALGWLEDSGWVVAQASDIAPDTPNAARGDYGEVVLNARLRSALARLNPELPAGAIEDALRRLTRPGRGDTGGPQPRVAGCWRWSATSSCSRTTAAEP